MNSKNIIYQKNISEQKEDLLKINKNIFYWVYEVIEDSDKKIIIKNIEEVLACDPKNFNNIKWLRDNNDMIIIDLLEFKKWNIKFLNKKFYKNKYKNRKLKLFSNWIIELGKIDQSEKKEFFTEKFQILSNNNLKKENWINLSNNLKSELEKENYDNSPFIWKKEDWKYYLFIKEWKDDFIEKMNLLRNCTNFLTYWKKLDRNNFKDLENIKKFENSTNIKYEEINKILDEIMRKWRIEFYKVSDNTETYKNYMKKIIIKNNNSEEISWNYFVYNNLENNSIEYRSIKKIIFPEKTNILWRISLDFDKDQNKIIKENKNETLKQNKIKSLVNSILNKVKKIIR